MVTVKKIKSTSFKKYGFLNRTDAIAILTKLNITSFVGETEDEFLKRAKEMIDTKKLPEIEMDKKITIESCQGNIYKFNDYRSGLFQMINNYEEEVDANIELERRLQRELNNSKITNSTNIMKLKFRKTDQCYECGICNETIMKKEFIYDICHKYHVRCITIWLIENNNCPCCRKKIL